jgi:hypothetical protein
MRLNDRSALPLLRLRCDDRHTRSDLRAHAAASLVNDYVPPLCSEQQMRGTENNAGVEYPDRFVERLDARRLVEGDAQTDDANDRQDKHRPERIRHREIYDDRKSDIHQSEEQERLVVVADAKPGNYETVQDGIENQKSEKQRRIDGF